MKASILSLVLVFLTTLFSGKSKLNPEKIEKKVTLLDFGAKGDGKTDDSAAFLSALQSAGNSENKSLVIPGNYIFNLNNKLIDFDKFASRIVLEFDGGILKNGTLKGQQTRIKADRVKIFENINLSGSIISVTDFAYPEWYGVFPFDIKVDLVDALTKLDPVFYDISLSPGDYYTKKGEYMVKGLKGTSMAKTKVILETDRSNTYVFSLGKIGGNVNERNYDYNYIKDLTVVISSPNKKRLRGNRGIIIGAVHKPTLENIKVFLFGDVTQLTRAELSQIADNPQNMKNANVGIEFRGDSEVSHLSNIFTLSDIGILISQYTDIIYLYDYMSWAGENGLASVYVTKEAASSQNLNFIGQSWNQGLYGIYTEDNEKWNNLLNARFENIRIEQLNKNITKNGKVLSTSIRLGQSKMITNLIFDNVILAGDGNGIYIGETISGNVYLNKVFLYPTLDMKRDFAIKAKFTKASNSILETPFQIHLTNSDLYTDAESIFENSNKIENRSTDPNQRKNRFIDTVVSY